MRELEVIIKATDYGQQELRITLPANHQSINWRVEYIGSYKLVIHVYRTNRNGKITMQMYWKFAKFGNELVFDNGYVLDQFYEMYRKTIKHEQSKVEINGL